MPLPPLPVPTPRPSPRRQPDHPPANPPAAVAIRALATATDRLLASIDTMTDDEFTAPSVLPGWSRAHVLAHLALNAKGLAGVLTTLGQDDPLTMYVSGERRDRDIDALAAQPPARIADRVAVGASMLAQHLGGGPTPEEALEAVGAAGQLSADVAQASGAAGRPRSTSALSVFARAAGEAAAAIAAWSAPGTFDRVPGGPVMQAADIPFMRWREVEIHHADLDLGYRPADWPAEFAEYLLGVAAYDRGAETSMTLLPAGRGPVVLGDPAVADGLQISGSAADLAWWLVGRGDAAAAQADASEARVGRSEGKEPRNQHGGDASAASIGRGEGKEPRNQHSGDGAGLTAAGGELPRLGPWVRR